MEGAGRGSFSKGKDDTYKPLHMISGEDMVVEVLEFQSKDVKDANLEVCNEEGALGFGSLSRGPSDVESLSDPSFQKFISFSKFLRLPVVGHEKEIASLLRKMDTRKDHRVLAMKRRPSSTLQFVRELRNMEYFVNYCNSNKKERSQSSG